MKLTLVRSFGLVILARNIIQCPLRNRPIAFKVYETLQMPMSMASPALQPPRLPNRIPYTTPPTLQK